MGSPFPGMDPYLEGDLWQELHETLASAIRAQLVSQLSTKYVALLAKRSMGCRGVCLSCSNCSLFPVPCFTPVPPMPATRCHSA